MIASIAIAASHLPVTRNAGEFSRVADLDVERWQQGGSRSRTDRQTGICA